MMGNTQNYILSKIISLIKSSENKYKEKNFKGSLEDKLEIKSLMNQLSSNKEIIDEYKKELSKIYSSKFDLIKDHKMKIDDKKRMEIIKLLEIKTQEKLSKNDYEGAIKALRRSERYQ
tara:strand:- start:460 stop:813 length:354 start_codon:yes stop_codon:yes gene_type:complete